MQNQLMLFCVIVSACGVYLWTHPDPGDAPEPLYHIGQVLCSDQNEVTIQAIYPMKNIPHQYDATYRGTILSFSEDGLQDCDNVIDFNEYIRELKGAEP